MISKTEDKTSSMNRKITNDLFTVYGRKKFLNVTPKHNERFQPVLANGLFCNQDYQKLKQHHMKQKILFTDPIFTPSKNTLDVQDRKYNVSWKRPKDIVQNPEFIVSSMVRFDVNQGHLGDCWFLSAVATIADHPDLLKYVVNPDQTVNPSNPDYTGLVHFRFWQYGMWIDIVVDDYLPTLDGRLIYAQSTDKHEFWIALLEKAYAKLYGTYGSLVGGNAIEAIEDMTGGCGISLQLDTIGKDTLVDMINRSSFVCCSTDSVHRGLNLVSGHAYSVTRLYTLQNGTILVCIRNPWGKGEWTGDWSDHSKLWDSLSNEENVKHVIKEDGEFFMSLDDFMKHYTSIQCCNVTSCENQWKELQQEESWVKNKNAMGCENNTSYHMNPQYWLEVPDDDIVIISLLQKWTRLSKYYQKKHTYFIGFKIYKLKNRAEKARFGKEIVKDNPVFMTKSFIDSRSNTAILALKKGRYIIIPSTYYPNEEGDYMLRVFSKINLTFHEL